MIKIIILLVLYLKLYYFTKVQYLFQAVRPINLTLCMSLEVCLSA